MLTSWNIADHLYKAKDQYYNHQIPQGYRNYHRTSHLKHFMQKVKYYPEDSNYTDKVKQGQKASLDSVKYTE